MRMGVKHSAKELYRLLYEPPKVFKGIKDEVLLEMLDELSPEARAKIYIPKHKRYLVDG